MNRALVVLLCVALVSASPLHKLQAQIGQRSGAAATDMALASSGPTLDPNMVLDPSQDSVADQYPLTFNQYTACYNVPASDVITTSVDGPEYPWNYYGWYYDAPSTCGGNTRQIVLNDRLPGAASPRHVPANTTRATWWGITPEQYDQANMLDPYTGLSPYLPNGQPLKVLIWLNGAIDFDLEYVIYLNKIASSRGWLVRSIANHWGDFTWKYATPPNDWGQEALIQGYRVKDAQAAIQLLIEQNSDPTHPYYGKIDLAHIYLAGHSAGGAACFQAWKGSSAFLDIAPIANVAGVLPSLDPAMWMYNYTDVESLFGDVLYAGLWSEEQIRTQGWFGLHWANQNTLLNNHLIIKHMCHDMFQTSDCQLNLLAVITDSLSRTYDWAASGLSSQNYCLSPPDDKFLGPELPKAHLQDVANVIMLWMDRVIDAIELSAVTYSNIAYQVLFSTAAVNLMQLTQFPPDATIHYGRWHCGNYTVTDPIVDDANMGRATVGYYISGDEYLSTIYSLYNVPGAGVQLWAYTTPFSVNPSQSATFTVQPTWVNLLADQACGCSSNLLC